MNPLKNWWQERKKKRQIKKSAQSAVDTLISECHVNERFLIMCALSGVVATGGIILADSSIIIAAMVLAPLLNPLLSMGAGVILNHRRLVLYSLRAFGIGFGLVMLISFILGMIFVVGGIDVDVAYFLERFNDQKVLPVLMTVSFVSGFGAVYAWLKSATQANFVGVAIAVALIPFVSLYGLLFATLRLDLIPQLTLILFSNLVVIVFGAAVAFYQQGLGNVLEGEMVDEKLDEKKTLSI